jgi:MSHA biogenesis protein MshM
MYLEHFKLDQLPFTLTPNTKFYCNLPQHDDAMKTIMYSLDSGDGFLKIIAEVGVGKTLLCRRLLNSLDEKYISCYIPNPDLSPESLKKALAIELGVLLSSDDDSFIVLNKINEKLLSYSKEGKQVVLVIDEAQALSVESLESIRLLTNLETESSKLLQIILFGQPELDSKLQQAKLRQLQQRIMFSQYILPMTADDVDLYIATRLIAAGHATGVLFSKDATSYLYKKSHGIPRVLNMLCHKSLMSAYGSGAVKVDIKDTIRSFNDTRGAISSIDQSSYQKTNGVLRIVSLIKSYWHRCLGVLFVFCAAGSSVGYLMIHHTIR